ncbi:ABC transporter permease subunit [Patescibacteria group bacterium]|nr:ABC transporter permease subunit [Patescibacteria group bacterium]
MFLIVLMFAAVYPTILEQADKFEELIDIYPEAFLQAFGIDNLRFDTIEKFLAVEYYSIFWPIAMIVLVIGLAGSAIAGEIENGTIEHLLAKPIERWKLFLSKYAGGMLVILIFTLVSVFSIIPAAALLDIDYNFDAQLSIFALSILFALSIYSIGMLFSVIASEKGRVSLISGVIVIVMYILNLASILIEKIEWLQYFSLFHYYDYNAALLDSVISITNVLAFLLVIVATTALAAYWFEKRDIAI